jgi:hypothetical protein
VELTGQGDKGAIYIISRLGDKMFPRPNLELATWRAGVRSSAWGRDEQQISVSMGMEKNNV